MANRQRLEIYRCEVCGNIVEVTFGSAGTLTCCNQPMTLQEEKTADFANEKHVPIIEKTEKGVLVKVGSTDHPMTEEHYIQWIEIINGDYIQRKYLKPGDKPQAEFCVKYSDKLIAREYCNVHGNWKN
ncbi:MAG: desulfoferrodoxin [Spirochaetaceae bacterium]|jgi:superoxide reductase|nr:desulfoferrodoxin [Spirochaetaceae bacterium]